jgi:hypothetical protein
MSTPAISRPKLEREAWELGNSALRAMADLSSFVCVCEGGEIRNRSARQVLTVRRSAAERPPRKYLPVTILYVGSEGAVNQMVGDR